MDQRELAIITRLLGSDIKKPTALVHFQRQMSQVAQRIMTLLIFNAQETEADPKGHYEVRVKFVHDFLGWTESKNYERIYEAFREIKVNDIVWNFLGEDRTLDELRCSFLITLGISRRSGLIRYKFHPELLPVIRNPSVFAKLKLIMLAVLAHPKYAYPLYEFAADSFCRGKPAERISISKLKEYLGIPPGSYTDYVTFKEQVLQPSLKAINRISDYAVTYTTYREGRRVAGVVLHIERKSHWQQPLLLEKPLAVLQRYFGVEPIVPVSAEEDAAVSAFVASVRRYGIDERTARAAVAAYGVLGATEIWEKVVAEVERRKKGMNPVQDVAAYMARCLREGFGVKTNSERQKDAEGAAVQARLRQRRLARIQMEEIRALAQSAWRAEVTSSLRKIPDNEREMLQTKFVAEIESETICAGSVKAAFVKTRWKTPGIDSLFRIFVAQALGIMGVPDRCRIEAKQRGMDWDSLMEVDLSADVNRR